MSDAPPDGPCARSSRPPWPCVLLPSLIDAAGLPRSLPWVAGALAVSGAVTRVMAMPAVQSRLPAWLRTEAPERNPNEKSTT
ncbi:hypothetical protein SFUMM280S_06379 [Streptomyces fumanus]